ncbi:MAG: Asp-tRNA(Asn)/Glu-tRNA(Gln) amidotransferase subunit GatB [Candidatus Aenigmatarchaeota archaeon]
MKIKIGLETHVQLNTRTKLFCPCQNPANLSELEPNTLTCPTCLGLPGSKPKANRTALEHAIKIALALGCEIASICHFSRKTYFYPDMPKNFQITQYEIPLASNGLLEIGGKKIRIKRLHLEEDPARLVHVGGLKGKYTLVDYNRAGIPLVEIVTEPDFSSPQEARAYIFKLAAILEYLGVWSPKSSAVIKSDANISIEGYPRIEVKNITGMKEVEQALSYEILRQQNLLRLQGEIKRETRAWNPEIGATESLREKEEEEEYGYIFEPDLPQIVIDKRIVAKLKKEIPELPDQKFSRFVSKYRLTPKLAESLISDRGLAELFEWLAGRIEAKIAATWVAGPLKKTLNWHGMSWEQAGIKTEWVLDVLKLFKAGKLTDINTEMVIRAMVEEKKSPDRIIAERGLERTKADITPVIKKVIAEHQKAVEDYKKGQEKAIDFLVGKVIAETKGRVDAKEIREMLKKFIKK